MDTSRPDAPPNESKFLPPPGRYWARMDDDKLQPVEVSEHGHVCTFGTEADVGHLVVVFARAIPAPNVVQTWDDHMRYAVHRAAYETIKGFTDEQPTLDEVQEWADTSTDAYRAAYQGLHEWMTKNEATHGPWGRPDDPQVADADGPLCDPTSAATSVPDPKTHQALWEVARRLVSHNAGEETPLDDPRVVFAREVLIGVFEQGKQMAALESVLRSLGGAVLPVDA